MVVWMARKILVARGEADVSEECNTAAAEHRVEHKAECKAQHRAERDSAASGSIWDDWGGESGRSIGAKHVIRV